MKEIKDFFERAEFESFGISPDEDDEMGMSLIFSDPDEEKTYCLNIGMDKSMSLMCFS